MPKIFERYLKRILVFIASPKDLVDERKKFPKILEQVNKLKAKSKGGLLEPVGWEDTLPGRGRPQAKINEDIKRSDLVVMLLWARWGSPTGEFSSGFEEEYEVAYSNKKEIWLYFRSIPDKMLVDPDEQLRRVLDFRNRVEAEKKLLFRMYESVGQWQDKFTEDLCKWLDGHSPGAFELEMLTEYPNRIEQLSNELEESITKQIDAANTLAREARQQADSGHITKAEEYFAKALAIYAGPRILNDYGLFLTRIGALKKAEEKFIQLMRLCEKLHDKVILAAANGNLGIIYSTRGDDKAAEEMYKKALAIYEELRVNEGMASVYCNLGNIYKKYGDLVAAEEIYRKALAIDEKLGRKEGVLNVYGSLGNLYSMRGDLVAAEEMYKKALAIDEEVGMREETAKAFVSLRKLYVTCGDLKAAEDMYNKALLIFMSLGNNAMVKEIAARIEELKGSRGGT